MIENGRMKRSCSKEGRHKREWKNRDDTTVAYTAEEESFTSYNMLAIENIRLMSIYLSF